MDRPVLIYTGGKFLLKEWIMELLPEHEIYVEPFGGAASVLMSKPRAKREVYNDLNSDVVNVFRVLRDARLSKILARKLYYTPFAREEMQTAKRLPSKNVVERARQTIISAFMSRSRQARDGAGMRYSKLSNRAPEKDWCDYPDMIPKFSERLRGVMIENKPADKVLEFWDGPTTLFYCDPPYLPETRNDKNLYAHEMNEQEHKEMLQKLTTIKGMVILSGYDSALYGEVLTGWTIFRRESKKNNHEKSMECLWLNPKAMENSKQMTLDVNECVHPLAL